MRPERRRQRRKLRIGAWTRLGASVPMLLALVAFATALLLGRSFQWSVLVLPAVAITIGWLLGPTVTIGQEGLALRAYHLRREVPFARLARVQLERVLRKGAKGEATYDYEVVLELRDGREVSFGAPSPRDVYDAIVEAWRAYRNANPTQLDWATLMPQGESAEGWLDRLRVLTSRAEGYRVDAPEPAELLQLAEDGHAPEPARAAAVAALGARLRVEEAEAARLRVVADGSASPRLRAAIDASIEGDDDALREAMESVREHAARAGRDD
jgi:hypothetical protein